MLKNKKTMAKKCQHQNIIDHGEFQKYKYNLDIGKNVPIPNIFIHYEQCEDCGELRNEVLFREQETLHKLKNDFEGEKYVARETYYTNGGSLVERDGFGNMYYNGTKMSPKALKAKLKSIGDSYGDQDVSDNFKQMAHETKKTVQKKKAHKKQRLEEIRDIW